MINDSSDRGRTDQEPEMLSVLDDLLAWDQDITARAVARLHPKINAASSITRNVERSRLLSIYQQRQAEFRQWRGRPAKLAGDAAASALADRDLYISELESQVALLTSSHVALIRAIGELGGFNKWAQFYTSYRETRDKLGQLGAMPEASVDSIPASRRNRRRLQEE